MTELYPYSRQEAKREGELDAWKESHQANIKCARDIGNLIVSHTQDGRLEPDCARAALDWWGFHRVQFVLANTLEGAGGLGFEPDDFHWVRRMFVPSDPANGDFRVDADRELLAQFIHQAHAEYQQAGLFGPEHCGTGDGDYAGKVLVLRPERLKEECLSPQNMLWLAECGFGCAPNARGRAVYATCLGDGEKARWNREDFIGVLDEQYLPDWAQEKLTELQGPAQTQEQDGGPAQGGMEMR